MNSKQCALSLQCLEKKYIFLNKRVDQRCYNLGASQVVLVVKNPPANAEDARDIRSLGQEGPLEEGMATHSSTLVWRIPERGVLQAKVRRLQSRTRLQQLSKHVHTIIFKAHF